MSNLAVLLNFMLLLDFILSAVSRSLFDGLRPFEWSACLLVLYIEEVPLAPKLKSTSLELDFSSSQLDLTWHWLYSLCLREEFPLENLLYL